MTHIHPIINADPPFEIDVVTREIANKSEKIKLMQGDHNSERIGFKMARYVDGHDMMQCNKVEVHYLNISSDASERSADVYPVEDMTVDSESDDLITFTWLVSENATKYNGSLSFAICFKCLSGTIIGYAWHTAICSNAFTIGTGMHNGEAVIEHVSDILEAWKKEITTDLAPYIGENGNWFVNGTDLNAPARGPQGVAGANGADGLTPHIGENGNWFIGDTDTGVKAEGRGIVSITKGADSVDPDYGNNTVWIEYMISFTDGTSANIVVHNGKNGTDGTNGKDGLTPHIGENGNWWIGDVDTGKVAVSLAEGAPVVHSKGDSEKAVMSQKSVTEEFNKQSLVNKTFANALKGTASGAGVALYDVSPIEHTIKAQVKSKNLFDISKVNIVDNPSYNVCSIVEVGENYIKIKTPDNYSGNGYCSSVLKLKECCPQLKAGDVATLSFNADKTTADGYIYLNIPIMAWYNGSSQIITEDMLNSSVTFYGSKVSNDITTISNIQIELGTVTTEYSPFVADVSTVKVKAQGKNLSMINEQETTVAAMQKVIYKGYINTPLCLSWSQDFVSTNGASIFTVRSLNNYEYLQHIGDQQKEESRYVKIINSQNVEVEILIVNWAYEVGNLTNIQLEAGTTATEYEPYIEPTEYAVNADGTIDGLCSIYPTTTLIADTANVIIDAEYNKDANKVVASLEDRIAALESMIINN